MERLTLAELASATGGQLFSPRDDVRTERLSFDNFSIDSRTLRPGEVFWAIEGPNYNGHDFASAALAAGAIAVVAHQRLSIPGPVVVVNNTTEALARFAGWYRRLQDAFVVGITGSVGKTTTKELTFYALGGEPAVAKTRGNRNNEFGVPISIAQLNRSHRFGVFELGASHPGEIARLCQIVRPEVGVITHLGVAHLETFGGIEQIAAGKGELLDNLPTAGLALLPGDQQRGRDLASRTRAKVRLVGFGFDNDVRIELRSQENQLLQFDIGGSRFGVRAIGRQFALAAAFAISAARWCGRSDREIAEGLLNFEPVVGRCRVVRTSPITLVDDTYNANPDSMAAALQTLTLTPTTGRRYFVCGDMWGLGDWTAQAHRELGELAVQSNVDHIVAIGDSARDVLQGAGACYTSPGRLAAFADRQAAALWLRQELRPGDTLLAKGSRPMELEHLIADVDIWAESMSRIPVEPDSLTRRAA